MRARVALSLLLAGSGARLALIALSARFAPLFGDVDPTAAVLVGLAIGSVVRTRARFALVAAAAWAGLAVVAPRVDTAPFARVVLAGGGLAIALLVLAPLTVPLGIAVARTRHAGLAIAAAALAGLAADPLVAAVGPAPTAWLAALLLVGAASLARDDEIPAAPSDRLARFAALLAGAVAALGARLMMRTLDGALDSAIAVESATLAAVAVGLVLRAPRVVAIVAAVVALPLGVFVLWATTRFTPFAAPAAIYPIAAAGLALLVLGPAVAAATIAARGAGRRALVLAMLGSILVDGAAPRLAHDPTGAMDGEPRRVARVETLPALLHPRPERILVLHRDAQPRAALLGEDDRFDVIVTDLAEPWRRGTNALLSADHLAELRRHLRPGGVSVTWIALWQVDTATLAAIADATRAAFPHVALWRGDTSRRWGTIAVVASDAPISTHGSTADWAPPSPDLLYAGDWVTARRDPDVERLAARGRRRRETLINDRLVRFYRAVIVPLPRTGETAGAALQLQLGAAGNDGLEP